MQILIIEDEHFAAQKLIQLIHQYDPEIEVLAQMDTIEEAVAWFGTNNSPDLLFLDIHLADGSSFEIFEQASVNCPIIFTTAYDQYAIQAFKMKSVDYLLKPIQFKDLKPALDKYFDIFGQQSFQGLGDKMRALATMLEQQDRSYKTRFLVKVGHTIKTIPIAEVAYFTFEDRTTILVTREKRRYPVKHTLDELEPMLDPLQFNRANRQFIVNIDAIQKISPWFKGRLKLELNPPQQVDLVISTEKTKTFKEWLDR